MSSNDPLQGPDGSAEENGFQLTDADMAYVANARDLHELTDGVFLEPMLELIEGSASVIFANPAIGASVISSIRKLSEEDRSSSFAAGFSSGLGYSRELLDRAVGESEL